MKLQSDQREEYFQDALWRSCLRWNTMNIGVQLAGHSFSPSSHQNTGQKHLMEGPCNSQSSLEGGVDTPAASSQGEDSLHGPQLKSPLAKGDNASVLGIEQVVFGKHQEEKEVNKPPDSSITLSADDSGTTCHIHERIARLESIPDESEQNYSSCRPRINLDEDNGCAVDDSHELQRNGSTQVETLQRFRPLTSPDLKLPNDSPAHHHCGRGKDLKRQHISSTMPSWLQGLLDAELFVPCKTHHLQRRNETNFFCPECSTNSGRGICRHCLEEHAELCCCNLPLFQIRRYMYQCVVHADELAPNFDLTGVQAYCINARRAVLIHPKPPPPTASSQPAFVTRCRGCSIPLRPDCLYCSLKCKVDVDFNLQPSTPGAQTAHPGPMKQDSYPFIIAVKTPRKGSRSSAGSSTLSSSGQTSTMAGTPCRRHDAPFSLLSGSKLKRRKVVRPLRSYFS